jgi:hypothetical protein
VIANSKPEIESDSEVETVDKEERELKNMMKGEDDDESRSGVFDEGGVGDMKTYLEGNEDKEIQSVHDLPGMSTFFITYRLQRHLQRPPEGVLRPVQGGQP